MWNRSLVIRRFLTLAVWLGLACTSIAQDAPPPPVTIVPAQAEPEKGLSVRDAIVLGVVEGITEFIPISSTGHLIITNRALGFDRDEPLRDPNGELLWFKPPTETDPVGVPLTLKLAADTYIIVIQVGAILAVVFVFWGQLVGILRGLAGQNAAGLRLLRNLLLAFIPAAVVGLTLDDWIESTLFSVGTVVAALVSGACLMFGAERWRRLNAGTTTSRKEPSDLTPREAVQIGLWQCLSLWPGMSRSMVTMVGGYFAGLSPARAAEFSFLVGLPVLGGAAFYKGLKTGPAMLALFGWTEMIIGGLVAAMSAALAVRFLVAYLSRYGLGVFAIYRIVLAGVLTWLYLV